MHRWFLRFSIFLYLIWSWKCCLAIDFCSIPACKGRTHIGCNNTMMFDHSCLRFSSLVDIRKFRRYLVILHNKYRQEVASGMLEYIPPARKMPELVWNPYLSVVAEYHLKTCNEELPEETCVATDDFPDPRVNYADDFYPRPQMRESNVREMTVQTEDWLNEVYELKGISTDDAGPDIGNIINDQGQYFGCAAGKDFDLRNVHFALVCYYSAGPPKGGNLYEPGTFNSSLCPQGKSEGYPNLCQTPTLND